MTFGPPSESGRHAEPQHLTPPPKRRPFLLCGNVLYQGEGPLGMMSAVMTLPTNLTSFRTGPRMYCAEDFCIYFSRVVFLEIRHPGLAKMQFSP